MNNDLFISPYMIGGLGNQMYMIATAHSYSLDHDIPMIVNKVDKVPIDRTFSDISNYFSPSNIIKNCVFY